jgi:hypothetical protein
MAGSCLWRRASALNRIAADRIAPDRIAPAGETLFQIKLDPDRTTTAISPGFMGLGYEISSVAQPNLLTGKNALYIELVRTLGANGVIRVGGNTSDYASYKPLGRPVSSPKATVINDAVLHDLGSFLDATGWKLIWGLNLGGGSAQQAVEETQAVLAGAGRNLLAIEIGNEPDLFPHGQAHRPESYGYSDYLEEYRVYRDAIHEKFPSVQFAGPDAARATDWVTSFANDEKGKIRLLTHHYYRENQNPASTIEKLLNSDPKLEPMLQTLEEASAAAGVPYRICETNSFSGGGRPGVSDAFGSALWVLDFMFRLASARCSGVNIETGVNQLGFVSSYSPIGDDEHGHYSVPPVYYGMLAFAQASKGRLIEIGYDPRGRNITAYAVRGASDEVWLTLINKEISVSGTVEISVPEKFSMGEITRLRGPSVYSKTGVTLGESSVGPDGRLGPSVQDALNVPEGKAGIPLPAASAAMVRLHAP